VTQGPCYRLRSVSHAAGRSAGLAITFFGASDVQMLRPEVCIAAQHLPILVPGNESDLLNRKACFEEPACAFVAQVVEVKVFDLEFSALPAKSCTDRLSVVWKYASAITFRKLTLILNNCAGVISTNV